MVRLESPATEVTLLFFACLPMTYAIRTLMGMKRKALYPLLRIRLRDGSHVPMMTM
ncbi:MAG TPA: hypothetical protein VM842_04455 [Nitrospira sp.]|nr:hypothetical protein [Nitrospira sp.]